MFAFCRVQFEENGLCDVTHYIVGDDYPQQLKMAFEKCDFAMTFTGKRILKCSKQNYQPLTQSDDEESDLDV